MKYDDYTRMELVELMQKDIKAYLALLTQDHLNQLLASLAKSAPLTEEEIEELGNTHDPATVE